MKSGDGSFRHTRAPQPVHPTLPQAQGVAPADRDKAGLGRRAQRRLEESEARRRQRQERRRERKKGAAERST